ncbi:TetR/AcrR family transcriptional regulator [Pseudokineococcus marinus]|uniref:TetR/AcrR family transcriptional regulator n=1 Tax=Pseudokineococcus marinus TaxID=351215 RepID=A0A849BY87_9ACTN|nr:TetR/AcrR family transcriptional regulator [Pseudokineococcus marinus]NNH22488.1 TetR/AcrR family transcriptional regulator [Pseudokineococcus marinus]
MSQGVGEVRAVAEAGRGRLRDDVVRATLDLLAEGGRDAVSTRAVAAAAGTQAPTIYRLFGDKAGLLAAVAEHGYATYLAAKPPARGGDPVAELRAGWDLHVGFGLANPALFSLMYGDPVPGRRPEAASRALGVLRSRMTAIAAAGRLRVDVQLAADMVHAAACGVVLTLLGLQEGERDLALSSSTFDAVMAAVTTDALESPVAGAVPAANALRAELPGLDELSPAERDLLGEWLDRVTGPRRAAPPLAH